MNQAVTVGPVGVPMGGHQQGPGPGGGNVSSGAHGEYKTPVCVVFITDVLRQVFNVTCVIP